MRMGLAATEVMVIDCFSRMSHGLLFSLAECFYSVVVSKVHVLLLQGYDQGGHLLSQTACLTRAQPKNRSVLTRLNECLIVQKL